MPEETHLEQLTPKGRGLTWPTRHMPGFLMTNQTITAGPIVISTRTFSQPTDPTVTRWLSSPAKHKHLTAPYTSI